MSKVESYEGAIDRGLEGIVACSSAISTIHGSTLLYRGYTIEDLAEHATFEEVIHLLWRGTIPNAEELAELQEKIDAWHKANRGQGFGAQAADQQGVDHSLQREGNHRHADRPVHGRRRLRR